MSDALSLPGSGVGIDTDNRTGVELGRRQLSETVAAHLREQIISGQLLPGAFLRIDAIARRLNVSTTPVREGLLLLQTQAFVRLMPRRGFIVNSFDRDDLRDLFWAQASIGAELARRAACQISPGDLSLLQSIHVKHERSVAEQDLTAAVQLGHQFHRVINLAARSPRMALLLGSLTKQLSNQFYASIEGQLENSIEDHPLIIAALRRHDERLSHALMFSHISSSAEHLIAKLEREGLWSKPALPDVSPVLVRN